jgi:flagellar biosynthetic protein FlhB
LVLPIVLVAFIAALAGNIVQVGFLFTVKPLVPDFSRIVPRFGRFFKRAFFSGEAVFNLAKSMFKVAVIVVIAYLNIRAEIEKITNLMTVPFMVSFTFIVSIAFRIIVEATIAMLVLAIFDYVFQQRQHLESLKMSRQEVKEERRMYEGDPLVRSRLRERMREIMSRSMIRAVPEADVVITNPTHYSVALEYDRIVNPAPLVVAKGVDSLALKIREIAEENAVPIIENRPLARALYNEVEVGDTIPEKYYEVMAAVIAEAWRISGKAAERAG